MYSVYDIVVPTIFGNGAVSEIGKRVKAAGCKKVLFIYDGFLPADIVSRVTSSLEESDIKYVSYGGVIPDVPDYTIAEVAEIARNDSEIDCIVGLGGGSTMDTCKASNVLMRNPGVIADYYRINGGVPENPGFPLFLIPTTAGSGSECAAAAVVTDTSIGGVKRPLLNKLCCTATLAIIDPLLTISVPENQVKITAYDAFAHAFECYVSDDAFMSPVTDACSIQTMKDVLKYLPLALKDPENLKYREKLAYAANLAGIAIANAHANKGHAIGHALGSTTHAPHGVCVSAGLAFTVDLIAEDYYDRLRDIAEEIFRVEVADDISPKALAKVVSDCIRNFEADVGMPTIKEHGATVETVMKAAEFIDIDPLFRSGRTKNVSLEQINTLLAEICKFYNL